MQITRDLEFGEGDVTQVGPGVVLDAFGQPRHDEIAEEQVERRTKTASSSAERNRR